MIKRVAHVVECMQEDLIESGLVNERDIIDSTGRARMSVRRDRTNFVQEFVGLRREVEQLAGLKSEVAAMRLNQRDLLKAIQNLPAGPRELPGPRIEVEELAELKSEVIAIRNDQANLLDAIYMSNNMESRLSRGE